MEAEIMSADPLKLVGILYRAAIESVAAARRHIQNQEVRERARKITRASTIINELMLSLDHSAGGEISRNLVELYAYMQTRLIEANTQQASAPLEEVETLLITLQEAWTETARAAATLAGVAPESEYAPA
jgi:flagellar protein FliS